MATLGRGAERGVLPEDVHAAPGSRPALLSTLAWTPRRALSLALQGCSGEEPATSQSQPSTRTRKALMQEENAVASGTGR